MIVSGLASFEDLLLNMKDKYEKLNKECETLRETLNAYNKEDEIRKRDEQIRELEERALEVFTEKEDKEDKEFREAHWISCKNGNDFIYRISGTGLGNCITVTCPCCRKSKDITDASDW